jgi:hypothetical protein
MVTAQVKAIFNLYCRSENNNVLGKTVDRRDTLSSHQSSAKHAACIMMDTSKTKHMTGLMDKGIAKVN